MSDKKGDSVTVLTRGIARLLELNCPDEKLNKLIKHLSSLCFGPPDDKFSRYFGLWLSPDECVDCLLSLEPVQAHIKRNAFDGIKLIDQVLQTSRLSKTSGQFLSSILPRIIQNVPANELQPIFESLWKFKDKSSFPVPLVEFMLLERKKLETILIQLYFDSSEFSSPWSDPSTRNWISWSSQSPFIFQTVSNVLNNILVHSNNGSVISNIIISFIESVKLYCRNENGDFIKLYPLLFQSLVMVLNVDPSRVKFDPSYNEFEVFVVKSLRDHISDQHITLMLLSHFPKWISIVSSHRLYFDVT